MELIPSQTAALAIPPLDLLMAQGSQSGPVQLEIQRIRPQTLNQVLQLSVPFGVIWSPVVNYVRIGTQCYPNVTEYL